MDKSMTIVFVGFDGYSDLWSDLFTLFNRFWPDCPYKILFVNNTKEVSFPNVETIHAGEKAEWSEKLRQALQNCDSPYICLLLEDFFVGKKIETALIQNTFSFIKEENIRFYKLTNMSKVLKDYNPAYKGRDYLHIIRKSEGYGICLQAAIWERKFLEEKLGTGNYNAWKFEFDRVKESDEDCDDPIEGCVFDDRNILNLKHGVVQSKYIPSTVAYFNKIGYKLNIERECLSYFQYYRKQFIPFVRDLLPKKTRKFVKKVAELFGMKFVSTIRDKK